MTREYFEQLVYEKLIENLSIDQLNEGVDWEIKDDDTIDLSINQDRTDKANSGDMGVDTRIFGNQKEILKGDDTTSGHVQSLKEKFDSAYHTCIMMESIIRHIQTDRQSPIYKGYGVPEATLTTVKKWFKECSSDEILVKAKLALERHKRNYLIYRELYFRAIHSKDTEKIARYNIVGIKGTDVKCIALFSFNDFNFSDAIKHGSVRQNSNIDNLLGISKGERKKEGKSLKQLNVTYDGKYKANGDEIDRNFSLHDVKDGHSKQNYGLGGEGGYNSVVQFLDKSIIYAKYALDKEQVKPNFIVTVPSSSKFNQYYATNLSNKLGVPYIKDFFKRNLIKMKYSEGDILEKMDEQNFSEELKQSFFNKIQSYFFIEVAAEVSKPLKKLIEDNKAVFSDITIKKNDRTKIDLKDVYDCLLVYAYQTIVESVSNEQFEEGVEKKIVEKYLINKMFGITSKLYQKPYDSKRILSESIMRIKTKVGIKVFRGVLKEMYDVVIKFGEKLRGRGYKLNFTAKSFKITAFRQQERQFLDDIYVVADELLNDKSPYLQERFQKANFLIIDEDINSGQSFRLTIDALENKLFEIDEKKIWCLANAYSPKGR